MDIEAMLELEAGRELDRVVAEALGVTIRPAREVYPDESDGMDSLYFLFDRDGVEIGTGFANEHNPFDSAAIPHYSTDANAALSLVSAVPNGVVSDFRLVLTYDGWSISWEAFYRHHKSEADTPALAIVRTWLAHQHAMKRGGR